MSTRTNLFRIGQHDINDEQGNLHGISLRLKLGDLSGARASTAVHAWCLRPKKDSKGKD